jgi:hypothetical protein
MQLINLRQFDVSYDLHFILNVRVLNWFVHKLSTTVIHYTHLDDESKVKVDSNHSLLICERF